MTTINHYRIYCNTESAWVEGYGISVPTVCYNNNGHTVNANSVQELLSVSENTVTVNENSAGTGGHYGTTTMVISASANQVSSGSISWPFPVSALSVEFITTSAHEGDCINMSIGKDTITGSITANTVLATAWSAQNYTAGDRVTYNSKRYTCTTNTVSNEVPTDTAYWTEGYEIPVSQTVIDNVAVGYNIKMADGTNSDDMGRVLSVDTVNNKIYVENNAVNTFASATPTYIKQSVYSIKDYEIGPAWRHELGSSKIGGSIIPKDITVTVDYDNKSGSIDKSFIGIVEYMY